MLVRLVMFGAALAALVMLPWPGAPLVAGILALVASCATPAPIGHRPRRGVTWGGK